VRQGNLDHATVDGFGKEWVSFDQSSLSDQELEIRFEQYFRLFPWDDLPQGSAGFDAGCGSGRWAGFVAPRVGELHCIDASAKALEVTEHRLSAEQNCVFHHASIENASIEAGSMDFGYCLGVLHHVPDPAAGIRACTSLLRPGAPLLLYLYYALENRPRWFRGLWRLADACRRLIRGLPHRLKVPLTTALAALVYLPLARASRLLERAGVDVDGIPLATYRDSSFYTMRTDALDRFGTALERRFTRDEISVLMETAGLERIAFSPEPPYWCAIGYKPLTDGQ
jgi:SAM-dependent methyltransferase